MKEQHPWPCQHIIARTGVNKRNWYNLQRGRYQIQNNVCEYVLLIVRGIKKKLNYHVAHYHLIPNYELIDRFQKKIYKCTHTGRERKYYFEYECVKISCNNYYYSNTLRPRAFIQVLGGQWGTNIRSFLCIIISVSFIYKR